jgi:hypothetical protein
MVLLPWPQQGPQPPSESPYQTSPSFSSSPSQRGTYLPSKPFFSLFLGCFCDDDLSLEQSGRRGRWRCLSSFSAMCKVEGRETLGNRDEDGTSCRTTSNLKFRHVSAVLSSKMLMLIWMLHEIKNINLDGRCRNQTSK